MKHVTISLRRRHLMIAGLAGIAAPASLFAGQSGAALHGAPQPLHERSALAVAEPGAGSSEEKLVVSGRILSPDGKPLAGATIDAWRADAKGDCVASVTTDADGRFMFTALAPAEYPGRAKHLLYRVSHKEYRTSVTQLHFAHAPGISGQGITRLHRDEAGVWRAAFGLTLA